jgi:uncharacterized membrane protein YjgN (DUF898 family)
MQRSVRTISSKIAALAAGVFTPVIHAYAQTFQGAGLNGGIQHGTGIQGIAQNSDIRGTAVKIIVAVLNFLAVIAVAVVVIAGFYLVLSLGEDDGKEKAKKTIFYTLIGLVVILLARVIVGFVTSYLASEIG